MLLGEGRMADDGIVPSARAREGLRRLGEDIASYLSEKETDIKTTTSKNGAIINNIYNYGTRTPSVKFGFVRTVWAVFWMVVMIAITWTIITNPGAIIHFGNWLYNLFV